MPEQRDANLDLIRRDGAFDVIVIGGGINGIGVYRELALQGLRVLLIERNDFCSGCSAAPSRMIHGGLRYLENGEFDLVWESLRERDALLLNAPHMVRALPTTIPINSVFSGLLNGAAGFLGMTSRPASRGALPIKIGLMLYDWTTRHRRLLPKHRFRGARATLRHWPALSPRLRFSATYHDAWISYPERLGLELVLDTKRLAPGSVALNHAEILQSGEGFAVIDGPSGAAMQVTASAVVNATGAWLDEALASLSDRGGGTDRFISGTKGSHLILDCQPLYQALGGHMIFFEREDGRVCIIFPYLGKVLAGSTDIRVDKADRVCCEPEERDYILGAVREVFPTVSLSSDNVVYSYSGIRPLPKSDHEFTGRISRGHVIHRVDGAVPQFCMVGGKWTTFRAFAEQAADVVLEELGRVRARGTIGLAIGGGDGFPKDPRELETALVARHGISVERAAWLVDAYGTRADGLLGFCLGRPDDVPLDGTCCVTSAEIAFLARNELVVGLEDMLLRRTPLAIRGDVSTALIGSVATAMAKELGWSVERQAREVATVIRNLAKYHGVSLEMLERRTRDRSNTCV
ncbi:glycerol-3-phosphate dehydrogenase/oxidase [Mesorhizobium sp. YC-39]|uniref:glycerol-3-phosphate dehydrogenase/oxidase n=1 Tax=unclassified Mesorhizobium TaxID=325217 RepID=UPI0021E78AC5|nr:MULTISPECIES: glycerol-3-phosphate dehydrogenase/oxidase [unclassified Mesorhizobium]MCV3211225.1 glycerol-3-phosphate dehydrogenase/oxidase [Mesorhizobium sp. YC-2]MCV3232950.1 glycerol-3-phosphate dehydrogenase/oxidase [Mesorhizobium sp. YC-39]